MLNKNQKKNRLRQISNRKYKTLIKNQFKKVDYYLQEKKVHSAEWKTILSETQKVLDKATNKKIIHKNKAARKKSKLYKLFQQETKQIINN